MTNTLATFTFNTHNIRVIDQEGSPWFVAADVCEVLSIANASHAATNLANDEVKLSCCRFRGHRFKLA